MTNVSNRYFRQHIENHFDDSDLDVVCRKRKQNYAIYWADDREPLARLRPTGQNDDVEVCQWDGGRWQPAGEFGLVLPLDEALEYITDDPDDLFFDDESTPDEVISEIKPDRFTDPYFAKAARGLHRHICLSSLLGGAMGGAAVGTVGGLTWGAIGALAFSFAWVGLRNESRILLVLGRFSVREKRLPALLCHALVVGIMATVVAAPGAVLGANVTEAIGAGFWAHATGLVVGALSIVLMFAGRPGAWLVGFSAGLLLAAQLVDAFELRNHLFGLALVALVASTAGKLCSAAARGYLTFIQPAFGDSSDGTPELAGAKKSVPDTFSST